MQKRTTARASRTLFEGCGSVRYTPGVQTMMTHKLCRIAVLLAICLRMGFADEVAPEVKAALNRISADELKGDLSFLASDVLQGRYTPSPGLEVAAEFIASKFRAAGLEPGGNKDYFQTAEMVDRHLPKALGPLIAKAGRRSFSVAADKITVLSVSREVKIENAPVLAFAKRDPALLKDVDLKGKAVLAPTPDLSSLAMNERRPAAMKMRAFDAAVLAGQATLEITLPAAHRAARGSRLMFAEDAGQEGTPVLAVESEQLKHWTEAPAKAGETRKVSIDLPAPDDQRFVVKNVIGVLRGSDPRLKNTCVLLTAHYDHIGTVETGATLSMSASSKTGDQIFNGANDDGSGTVSVIEVARALAKLEPHPKRSIVFMTFFGEERGEFGSQYYGRHPLFPMAKTVADMNLEQMGRTDSTKGPQVGTASLTGYDYSDLTKYFEDAGRELGIKVYKDAEASDAYFARSDNAALAEQGVPAHTMTVAFDYPDYHGLADEWQKIDYDNMAKVDRMVALGVVNLANSEKPPEWNAENPLTEHFRAIRQKLKGQ